MAMLGCREVGIEEPKSDKSLIVWVEIDRCAADAIQSVTGCKLGKRTLKHKDYGKLAATFLNLETGRAVRVAAKGSSRGAAGRHAPHGAQGREAQLQGYKVMADTDLFAVSKVRVEVPDHDLPGPPSSRVACDSCGEEVNDRREVSKGNSVLCVGCAYGAYYVLLDNGDRGPG
jgi:formylmethanofuran dehydrogenase subunit E